MDDALFVGAKVIAFARKWDDNEKSDYWFPAIGVLESFVEDEDEAVVVFDGGFDGGGPVRQTVSLDEVFTPEEFSEWLQDRLDTQYKVNRFAYNEWPGVDGLWKRDGHIIGEPDFWRPVFRLPVEDYPFDVPEGCVPVAECDLMYGMDRTTEDDIVYIIDESEIFPFDEDVSVEDEEDASSEKEQA